MSGNEERVTPFPYCTCETDKRYKYWSMKVGRDNITSVWVNSPENVEYEIRNNDDIRSYPTILMRRIYLSIPFNDFWLKVTDIKCCNCNHIPTGEMVVQIRRYMRMNWDKRGNEGEA